MDRGSTIGFDDPDPKTFFEDVIEFVHTGDGQRKAPHRAIPLIYTDANLIQNTRASSQKLLLEASSKMRMKYSQPWSILHASAEFTAGDFKTSDIVARIISLTRRLIHDNQGFPLQVVDYVAVDEEDDNKRTRDGTVLIQYDPQQQINPSSTRALVRIYLDGRVLPDITWDPLPNQLPGGGNRKRDLIDRDVPFTGPQQSPLPTTFQTSLISGTTSLSPQEQSLAFSWSILDADVQSILNNLAKFEVQPQDPPTSAPPSSLNTASPTAVMSSPPLSTTLPHLTPSGVSSTQFGLLSPGCKIPCTQTL